MTADTDTPDTPRRTHAASRPARSGPRPIRRSAGFTDDPATYFDELAPAAKSTKPPMLLIHGGAHTGSCYLVTADGRPGWAYAFARMGYRVVVPDWPGCGRSGYVPYERLDGERVVAGLARVLASLEEPAIVVTHSMSGAYGWKLLERHGENIAMLVGVAPSPPGNIQAAPEVLRDADDAIELQLFKGAAVLRLSRTLPFVSSRAYADEKLIGTSKLFPRDQAARYAASLVAMPPRLILERANLGGSQLKVDNFASFPGKRVLVMTGTDDIDHPIRIDRPIADWLNDNGANADYVYLGDRDIRGNGHMMMLEENSDQLARFIVSWIEEG
jgi:pimeloyl-ACP methyl ester carboxylesterase